MQDKPPCEVCEHFRDRENKPTPCQECLPELMPENYDAWRIYSMVAGQLILSQAGPVDINHLAIHEAMELYKIEHKRTCFERVIVLARHMMQRTWEKEKAKQ